MLVKSDPRPLRKCVVTCFGVRQILFWSSYDIQHLNLAEYSSRDTFGTELPVEFDHLDTMKRFWLFQIIHI